MHASTANIWILLGMGLAGIIIMKRKAGRKVREDFGAFTERLQLLPPPQPPPPNAPHPLIGLSFAVSDIFDIVGCVTGFGSPDWARTHEPADQTSPSVLTILEGGATCIGKTVTDEMGYSIHGENKHYGMPTNPVSPARICGGSSSGSAVAVAAGLVDFSLGVDSSGGVRVPGACCGILGFRPSHGVVLNARVIPVSPSLDTIGWFARDPSVLQRVGHVLLQLSYVDSRPRRFIIADDCFLLFEMSMAEMVQVVMESVMKIFGKQIFSHVNIGEYIASKASSLTFFHDENKAREMKLSSLSLLAKAMLELQRHEFHTHHGEWITSVKPPLDSLVLLNKKSSQEASNANIEKCLLVRSEIRAAINGLLKDDVILVLPTLAELPPKLGTKDVFSDCKSFCLLAIASMSGCCQVTVPLGHYKKCPLSVSFLAKHGGDRMLLDTVQVLYAHLQEQVHVRRRSSPWRNVVSKEDSAENAKEKGNNAFKVKQWQKAVNFYSEAIRLNGKNAIYYNNRAAAYLELGCSRQAEEDCNAAIDLDCKNVKAYLRRGTAREMLGLYKGAIEDFGYALVLEPANKTASHALNRMKKLI